MAKFAFKVTGVFEFKDSLALIADTYKGKEQKDKVVLELRRADGSVLHAVSIPVTHCYGFDVPADRPYSLHINNFDINNSRIAKPDIPIGTEVWFSAERVKEKKGFASRDGKLKEAI